MGRVGLLIVDLQPEHFPSGALVARICEEAKHYPAVVMTRKGFHSQGALYLHVPGALTLDKPGMGLEAVHLEALRSLRCDEWHLCGVPTETSVLACAFDLKDAGFDVQLRPELCEGQLHQDGIRIISRHFGRLFMLEPLQPQHEKGVLHLGKQLFGSGYLDMDFLRNHQGIVALEEGRVVGFVIHRRGIHLDREIRSLAVTPARQRQGIGARLLQAAFNDHPGQNWEATLWKNTDGQVPAQRLFESLGFEAVAEREDYCKEDSITRGYTCAQCGHPCTCSAVLVQKRVPAS